MSWFKRRRKPRPLQNRPVGPTAEEIVDIKSGVWLRVTACKFDIIVHPTHHHLLRNDADDPADVLVRHNAYAKRQATRRRMNPELRI